MGELLGFLAVAAVLFVIAFVVRVWGQSRHGVGRAPDAEDVTWVPGNGSHGRR